MYLTIWGWHWHCGVAGLSCHPHCNHNLVPEINLRTWDVLTHDMWVPPWDMPKLVCMGSNSYVLSPDCHQIPILQHLFYNNVPTLGSGNIFFGLLGAPLAQRNTKHVSQIMITANFGLACVPWTLSTSYAIVYWRRVLRRLCSFNLKDTDNRNITSNLSNNELIHH